MHRKGESAMVTEGKLKNTKCMKKSLLAIEVGAAQSLVGFQPEMTLGKEPAVSISMLLSFLCN